MKERQSGKRQRPNLTKNHLSLNQSMSQKPPPTKPPPTQQKNLGLSNVDAHQSMYPHMCNSPHAGLQPRSERKFAPPLSPGTFMHSVDSCWPAAPKTILCDFDNSQT